MFFYLQLKLHYFAFCKQHGFCLDASSSWESSEQQQLENYNEYWKGTVPVILNTWNKKVQNGGGHVLPCAS